MQDLASFYQNQIDKHAATLAQVKQQLVGSSIIRLLVFGLTGLSMYLLFGNAKLVLALALAGIILFLFLVSRHTNL